MRFAVLIYLEENSTDWDDRHFSCLYMIGQLRTGRPEMRSVELTRI